MNERIQQLAEQAGAVQYNVDYRGDAYPTNFEELKQFAELIVRECSHIAAKNQAEDMGWDISEIIKEHFGVEE